MGNSAKEKLMVTVSKMYYEYHMSQKAIAVELGLSRGYVCQLLEQARNIGIVEIKVNDFASEETEMELYLKQAFGLNKVKIVSTPANVDSKQLTSEIAKEACEYLDSIIKSNMIITFSWGATVFQISSHMTKHTGIKNITAIPLCGGISNLKKKVYVSEISSNIADAYNGTPLFLPLPTILESENIKKAIYSDTNINSLLNKSKYADIALFTVGGSLDRNVLYRGGYLDESTMRRLIHEGVVGDIGAHFINEYGEICDHDLDNRTISIDLRDLIHIKNKICVATGSQKVKALMGVLRKRYVDVLITDEDTVHNILKLM